MWLSEWIYTVCVMDSKKLGAHCTDTVWQANRDQMAGSRLWHSVTMVKVRIGGKAMHCVNDRVPMNIVQECVYMSECVRLPLSMSALLTMLRRTPLLWRDDTEGWAVWKKGVGPSGDCQPHMNKIQPSATDKYRDGDCEVFFCSHLHACISKNAYS